ncbi:PHP domain-containing protein [Labilibacter sediminis]|nr:PHP domain-containing protein [Labilibacter sediminis]
MKNLSTLPEKSELLEWLNAQTNHQIFKVNAHLHTPYSFSAFKNIAQIFELAEKEDMKVLGINDFYSTDGYSEFNELALKHKIFPLFNIEFIGVNLSDKEKGIRLNDPGNPGRVYLSGKGLNYPPKLEEPYLSMVNQIKKEIVARVTLMTDKVNELLSEINSDIYISIDEILEKYAVDLVRERHIAKAIRVKVFEKYSSVEERYKFFEKLYSGQKPTANLNGIAETENEIRNNLLKAGKRAFVEENSKAFLEVNIIKDIILNAGGIPTYPLLADNNKGEYTRFEQDKETLLKELKSRRVYSIEFIPNRNDIERLKDYAMFFWENEILVTFGTEHNTPEMIPLTVQTRGHVDLDEELKELSYKGACVVAAHQYLVAKGEDGFVKTNGERNGESLQPFVELGHAVISKSLN